MKRTLRWLLIALVLCLIPIIGHSQSTMEFQSGTNIEVTTGADICADNIIINGTYSGDGTQCGGALPITFASFSAQMNTDRTGVLLEWTTLGEVNNFGFYVERRAENEQTFSDLPDNFVQGAGTTLEEQRYSWTDENVINETYYYRLRQVDLNGDGSYSHEISVTVSGVLGTGKESAIPKEFSLGQNYPNPFNPVTSINYGLPTSEHVKLSVYNMLGQEVAALVDEVQGAGYKAVSFDANRLPSGMYTYRITAGTFTDVKRMMLVK